VAWGVSLARSRQRGGTLRRAVDALPALRLVLDLDPFSTPIQGRLLVESGHHTDARAFSGWIELSSLIEEMRVQVSIHAGADPDAGEPDLWTSG
jgi:hypothetical protein